MQSAQIKTDLVQKNCATSEKLLLIWEDIL